MHQQVAAEDAPEMARLLDAKMHSVEQIIEEEQVHRVQVAALANAVPSNGEGGRTGGRTGEAQQFNGRTPGHVENIT